MSLRADGKRLKNVDPMYTVAPFIMDKRNDALNSVTLDIPLEPISAYLKEAREKGKAYSHMDIILAAYARTVGQFPSLNRFVVNKRIYARNELAVGMVVLKLGDHSNETMSKMYFDYDLTIDEVHNIITEYVDTNRQVESANNTDKMIKFLVGLPGILGVLVGLFKFMDRHGLLPKFIIDLSPFHTSLTLTNLASIRTNHIYHHIYNFGTTSLFIAMGNTREVPKRKNGEIVHEKCLPLGLVMDERICSGLYFSEAFRTLKKYLSNPALLELPPDKEPIYEVDFKKKPNR